MNPQNVPPEQQVAFMIGAIIGALVVGGLCGLLPFFLAKSRGRTGLGVGALVTCIIGGFILGILLAAPLMIIFSIIILALGHAERVDPRQGFPMHGQQQQQYPYAGPPQPQYPPTPPGQRRL